MKRSNGQRSYNKTTTRQQQAELIRLLFELISDDSNIKKYKLSPIRFENYQPKPNQNVAGTRRARRAFKPTAYYVECIVFFTISKMGTVEYQNN